MKLPTLALFVALATPLSASESIKLRDGRTVTGTATAYDAEAKVLHFRVEGGEAEQFPLDELDARSVYLVHSSVIEKSNGKGQLQLANFARDAGLYKHAARRYGYAEKADASLKPEIDEERARLRSAAAEYCLANAKAAQEEGDAAEVEEWLTLLLEKLPGEPQAAEASAMLEQSYEAHREAKQAELDAAFVEKLEKDAKKGKAAYAKMVEDTRKGLTVRNDGQAKRLWEGALRRGRVVLEEIESLEKKYGHDARFQEGAEKYRQLTREQMIEINLHLASQANAKSSHSAAMDYANAALALDPKNRDALAARARIEQAANEGLIDW